MTVPLLAKDYAAYDWPRLGLTHPFIAPYGVYQSKDNVPVLISIQNDREFQRLCEGVLGKPGLEKDPLYANNKARNERRDDTNAIVQTSFGTQSFAELAAKLDAAQIAWARVSSVGDLVRASAASPHHVQDRQGRRDDPATRRRLHRHAEPSWVTCRPWDSTPSKIRREFAA